MASNVTGSDKTDRSSLGTAARVLALVLALTFLVVGVVGFFITGFDNFAAHDNNEHLLWFEINPLHNVVHLALGLAGLALFRTTRGALSYGYLNLIGYGAAFVYGLVAIGRTWDVLSINAADNVLHIALAIAGGVLAALGHAALSESRGTAAGREGYGATGRGRAPA